MFISSCAATDVAGKVIKVGPRVTNYKTGDKVDAMLNHPTGGGLAEYAVAKDNLIVLRPPEVSAAEGASLPVAGLAALQAVTESAGVKLDGTGRHVNLLITAASGGVGQYAVQLAKLGNTNVTATCGAHNLDLVKSLGADEVLDYKTPDGVARKYDVVIHCEMDIPWSTFEPNLSTNGKVIDSKHPLRLKKHGLRSVMVMPLVRLLWSLQFYECYLILEVITG
ncbi:hypothetical protein ES319_D07G102700v1 [Gossypium barbadense]|uniref:Enoyl reductase (ER) domain-containing protein n=1 Tax=Gossypium barbadense TaxID=3634 RepID=A0A5J5QRM9_GOSBA|nr:hypothetical protein ES319_D07G102700v1 [Gossypium barbadense]